MRVLLIVIACSLLSGFLFAWALPPASLWPLGWIAVAPVLAAVRGRSFVAGFGGGILALATTATVIRLNWLPGVPTTPGDPAWLYTGCGFFGFVASVQCGIVGEWKRITPFGVVLFGAFGVLLETLLLSLLPANLALTQWRVPPMLTMASVTGIWGVSWLLWSLNLSVAAAAREKRVRALIPVVAVASFAGLHALIAPAFAVRSARSPAVFVVQSPSTEVDTMRQWQEAATLHRDRPILSVWPEFAGMMAAPRGNTAELRQIVGDGPAVVTSFEDDARPLPHNVAALFWRGAESERYFKRKPFGGEKHMHAAGDRGVAVPFGSGKLGMAICYDSCFPSVMRETATIEGVDLIALPTIDPESPQAFIAAVHAAFTPFRAAELGVPIVRADGYAYSMSVAADGTVAGMFPPGERIGAMPLSRETRRTFYRFAGDWVIWLAGVVALYAIAPKLRGAPSPS